MSCFPESTYAFYVDGELGPDERRLVDAHLVGCRECRRLVVSLEEESALLRDVLLDRPRPSFRRAAPAPAPPRELALGFLPAIGLGVLVVAGLTALVEALPTGSDWILSLTGVYEMLFDVLFLLRDEAPELIGLLVAAAALGGVSALLLFALSLVSRRFTGTATLAALPLVLTLTAPGPARALDLRLQEEEITIRAGETVAESLVANAKTVRVDGVVEGDLAVLAERLVVRGEVRGNVYGVVRHLEVPGKVTGNLHALAETVRLDGEVEGSMYSASERLTIAQGAKVGRDATHAAEGASVEGQVGRDLTAAAQWLEVRGEVGGSVQAWAERVALLDSARVAGDVDAVLGGEEEEDVEIAPGAVVGGEVRSRRHEGLRDRWLDHYTHAAFYKWLGIRLVAAWVTGILLFGLVPRFYEVELAGTGAFLRSLGVGVLAALATPLAVVLVALTVVGIPVALAGVALFVVSVYVSGILVASLLGLALTRPEEMAWRSFGLALLVGLVILYVAVSIPFVGPVVHGVVALAGLGILAERALAAVQARRA